VLPSLLKLINISQLAKTVKKIIEPVIKNNCLRAVWRRAFAR
jgi:hypothetical protein